MACCKHCNGPISPTSVNCEGPCRKSFPAQSLNLRFCLDCYAKQKGLFWYCEECRIKKRDCAFREIEESMNGPELESPPRTVAKRAKLEKVKDPTLSAELWTEIFEHLCARDLLKVRLVCHRWRQLVDGSSTLTNELVLWFPKGVMMDREYSPSNLLPASFAVFTCIQIVTVGSWWPSFGAGLVIIRMDRCNVLVSNMLTLLKQTPNLECLYLADILIDSIDKRPVVVDFKLKRMELLQIRCDSYGQNLGVFLNLCPNLKELILHCHDYSDEFQLLLLKLPSYLKAIRTTLESLDVIATPRLLAELRCLELPILKKLNLKKINQVRCRDNRALIEICRTHPTLEDLDITDVCGSRGTILPEIGALLPNLKWLAVKVPKAPGIQSSIESIPQLRHLRLRGSSLNYPQPTFVSSWPNLQELHVKRVTFQEPDSLRHFLAQVQNVRVLHFEECKLRYWSCLLSAIRTQKQLRQLTLSNLSVNEMGRCCIDYLDNLTQLELAEFKVPQQMMVALLTMCASSLRKLALIDLTNTLDFEVVDVMCRKLWRLSELTIEKCKLSEEHRVRIRKSFAFVDILGE